MDIDINWFAVSLAAVSSFVVGAIWYSPIAFLEPWRKLAGLSKDDVKKGPGTRGWLLTAAGAFLQAFVLYHFTYLSDYFYTDLSWFTAAVTTAVWLWIGMQVALVLTHDTFEKRPLKLTALTAGNQLATLLAMALIIGLL